MYIYSGFQVSGFRVPESQIQNPKRLDRTHSLTQRWLQTSSFVFGAGVYDHDFISSSTSTSNLFKPPTFLKSDYQVRTVRPRQGIRLPYRHPETVLEWPTWLLSPYRGDTAPCTLKLLRIHRLSERERDG